ncbi:MAG: hypothetical protein PWP08_153 [Methanofollis sp.]|nr:hypothetical protein [Methanofollis sp.]
MKERRRLYLSTEDDDDPLAGMANLFDVAMVFAVALLVALVLSFNVPEMLDDQSSVTLVKNPGAPDMQIIVKDRYEIKVLNMTEQVAGGQGKKLGTAYRLENGQVIYVPNDNRSIESEGEGRPTQ